MKTKKTKNWLEFKTQKDWNKEYWKIWHSAEKYGKRTILEAMILELQDKYPMITALLKVWKNEN